MKARNVIALTSTILLLLLSIPSIVFFYGIPTIDATIIGNGNCDPSYPDTCIPSPPPDLDCGEISDKRFQVVPPDPHGFDRDGDGIGCEF
jgi:hypothetical protein